MRRTTMVAVLTALALTGTVTACQGEQDPGLMPAPAPSAAEASPGHRLVARGRVAIEVPDDWGSEVFDGCGRTPDGAVVFRLPGRHAGCVGRLDRSRSWVVLEEVDPDDGILLAMRRAGVVDGARVVQTGTSCFGAATPACDQTFAVAGERVLVQVHVRGVGARERLREVRTSLRLLGEGQTAVPPLRYGTADDDALAALAAAGLEGRIPEVDFPHYVTVSEPPAGTVVPIGSVVDLQVGDG